MEKLKILEIKMLRGEILKALFNVYPRGLKESTLKKAFIGNYMNIDVERQLEYLNGPGKEYIIVTNDDDDCPEDDSIIKLSPKGYDLIDGSIDADPGIAFS